MDLPDHAMKVQEEPMVIGMARAAGELTYRLRQKSDELMAFLAEIEEAHREFCELQKRMEIDLGVSYKADLPPFLMSGLSIYRDATMPQPSMPGGGVGRG